MSLVPCLPAGRESSLPDETNKPWAKPKVFCFAAFKHTWEGGKTKISREQYEQGLYDLTPPLISVFIYSAGFDTSNSKLLCFYRQILKMLKNVENNFFI